MGISARTIVILDLISRDWGKVNKKIVEFAAGTTICGYKGDACHDIVLETPCRFRVSADLKGLNHQNKCGSDTWFDPYWDLAPVNDPDRPHPQIEGYSSLFTHGPSYCSNGDFTPVEYAVLTKWQRLVGWLIGY